MEATDVQAGRKRAAVETYARHEATLRRTARRYSLCADDADDALQRGLEILLLKAPTGDPRQLLKWMQTVVKHEALAIRHERERMLAGPAALRPEPDAEDWVALLPCSADGPERRLERQEAIARSREALQALKPQELRALTLLAEGYSYAEIAEITRWTRTKINRCLAEGREQFRRLVASSEDGSRCEAMGPLLSAFCDGEASPQETAELREHLRACAACRATLRAYRAAPAAAAALAPAFPIHSLWERAREAAGEISSRLGARREAITQLAGGSGAGGTGSIGLAKIAAVCVATAGGACLATGVLPAPFAAEERPPRLERHQERRLGDLPPPETAPGADADPAPAPTPKPAPAPEPQAEPAAPPEAAPEGEPVATEPTPVSGEAIEAAPPPAPEPAPAPAPAPSSGGGSPAGEFGP